MKNKKNLIMKKATKMQRRREGKEVLKGIVNCIYGNSFSKNFLKEYRRQEKYIIREGGDYGKILFNLKNIHDENELKRILEKFQRRLEVNKAKLSCEDEEVSKTLNINIRKIENYLHKLNGYMKIESSIEGDYDSTTIVYTFTNSNKKKLLKWCEKECLSVGYKSYNTCSPYDCSGDLVSQNVIVKSNKVIIDRVYNV